MINRLCSVAILCAGILTGLSPSLALAQPQAAIRSATVARDVNGYRLGMTVAEARNIAPLAHIGNDQFEAKSGAHSFNFGVTPKGRIFRISSTQELGRFDIDRRFIQTLRQKLITKYGQPRLDQGNNFNWELIEPVTDNNGQTTPFRTMWMTAMVSGSGYEKTLDITMIDFRILWADQATLNRQPRRAAERRIQF